MLTTAHVVQQISLVPHVLSPQQPLISARAEFPESSITNDQCPESLASLLANIILPQAGSKLQNSASATELRSGDEMGINLETPHP